jgi:hypothetical protein
MEAEEGKNVREDVSPKNTSLNNCREKDKE